MWQAVLLDYVITFGWAIVGSVSMGSGIILALRLFDWSTPNVNEWELVKQGNIPIAIILGALIISLGIVISSAIAPKAQQGHVRVDSGTAGVSASSGSPFDP